MEEILLMQVAATLAGFELADLQPLAESDYPIKVNADGTVTVTPSDLAKQRKWVVWETFRTYYWPLVQAVADAKDWPQPAVAPTGGGAGNITTLLGQLAPLASALGPQAGAIATAIEGVVSAAKAVTATPPSNVPALPTPTK